MFRNIVKRATVFSTQSRCASVVPPKLYIQEYDTSIAEKYPRIMDVINGKCRVDQLQYIDRVAYFTATHGKGGSKGRGARKAAHRRYQTGLVEDSFNRLRAEAKKAKKVQHRIDIVLDNEKKRAEQKRREILPKLSTLKETVNKAPKLVDFKLTQPGIYDNY